MFPIFTLQVKLPLSSWRSGPDVVDPFGSLLLSAFNGGLHVSPAGILGEAVCLSTYLTENEHGTNVVHSRIPMFCIPNAWQMTPHYSAKIRV